MLFTYKMYVKKYLKKRIQPVKFYITLHEWDYEPCVPNKKENIAWL